MRILFGPSRSRTWVQTIIAPQVAVAALEAETHATRADIIDHIDAAATPARWTEAFRRATTDIAAAARWVAALGA
jgi:hypothetical protein